MTAADPRPGLAERRRALQRMGALALSLGAPLLARGATIVAVRVWPSADYTRVTIESDTALQAQHFVMAEPHRLVVDIEGLSLDGPLRELVGKIRPDDPFIAGVRVGQFQPGVVRLVLDLKQAVLPQQFALEPVAAYRHRLVFDLYPPVAPDPLLALIQDKTEADQRAAQAVQDALGELIARVDQPGLPAPAGPSTALPGDSPDDLQDALPKGPPHVQGKTRPSTTPRPRGPVTAEERQRVDRLIVVAIDPGHGGEDPGAIGPSGLKEKDVVLDVAHRLRRRLNAVPGMRAMLTRDDDYFVPLYERVHKARQVRADLLISIHADAFIRPEARGASVFALSTRGASSAAARWMAQKENAADMIGGVNVAVADQQVMRAMLDMSTHAQIQDSLVLGREVLKRIGRVGTLHKGQVEQAGFAVLKAPDVPSILVETAFISNPKEEALLRDKAYRGKLVEALATGVQRYFANNPPLARQRPA